MGLDFGLGLGLVNIVTSLPIAPKISVHLMENIRIDTSGCHPPRIIIFVTIPNWIWNFWYRDKLLKLLKFKASKGCFDLIKKSRQSSCYVKSNYKMTFGIQFGLDTQLMGHRDFILTFEKKNDIPRSIHLNISL